MNLAPLRDAGPGAAETVARAAAAVTRATDLDDVLEAIVNQVMALGATAAGVFLAELGDETRLRLVTQRNFAPEVVLGQERIAVGTPHLSSRAAETRELEVESMEELDPRFATARKLLQHTESRGIRAAPLIAFGRLLGVLTWTVRKAKGPSASDRATIRALTEVFAVGIARAEARVDPHDTRAVAALEHLVHAVAHRHYLQAALRERETHLRALFDHTVEFIGLLSIDGVLLDANRAALELVGTSREEVVGRPFWEGPWWSDSPEKVSLLRTAIAAAAAGEPARFETEHSGRDGRRVVIDFSLSPVRDDSGAVVLLVPEGRDVTAQKELAREREEWTSVIAHDLRNPIGAIALWMQNPLPDARGEGPRGRRGAEPHPRVDREPLAPHGRLTRRLAHGGRANDPGATVDRHGVGTSRDRRPSCAPEPRAAAGRGRPSPARVRRPRATRADPREPPVERPEVRA